MDSERRDEVEKTLRFNSEWLNEENPDLNPEHAAAVGALPRGNALLVVRQGPNSGSRFLLSKAAGTS